MFIRDTIGFEHLPEGLQDVALTRLAYPEATLKELGTLLKTPGRQVRREPPPQKIK